MKKPHVCTLAVAALVMAGLTASPATAGGAHARKGPSVSLVSVSSSGKAGNSFSSAADISDNGRWVVFASYSDNLTSGDSNDQVDVFWRDTKSKKTVLVSHTPAGKGGDGSSGGASISGDGQWVCFYSDAGNLRSGHTDEGRNIYLWSQKSGDVRLVSHDSEDEPAGTSDNCSLNGDGSLVALASTGNLSQEPVRTYLSEIVVWNRSSDTFQRVSETSSGGDPNDDSHRPVISANGRYVAYETDASNLAAGDTNNDTDVVLTDRTTGSTVPVSSAQAAGNSVSYDPSISNDGSKVVFVSYADNLVSKDTNDSIDVFLWSRGSGKVTRLSVSAKGKQGNGHSFGGHISGNGKLVAFHSDATNLIKKDKHGIRDIFLTSTSKPKPKRISVNAAGKPANNHSDYPLINANGKVVTYTSSATNLAKADKDNDNDVYRWAK